MGQQSGLGWLGWGSFWPGLGWVDGAGAHSCVCCQRPVTEAGGQGCLGSLLCDLSPSSNGGIAWAHPYGSPQIPGAIREGEPQFTSTFQVPPFCLPLFHWPVSSQPNPIQGVERGPTLAGRAAVTLHTGMGRVMAI